MVLQILSIDRLLDLGKVNSYVIILNGQDNTALRSFLISQTSYRISQDLSEKMVFVDGADVASNQESDGWRSQQLLKLTIARYLKSEYYLLLDAKNHFIHHSRVEDFFYDGLPITTIGPTNQGWLPYVRNSLNIFGVTSEKAIVESPPTVTPYLMVRSYVLGLLTKVEEDFGTNFSNVFNSKIHEKTTEFFMYYGYIASLGGPYPYANRPSIGRTLYTKWPQDPRRVISTIEEMRSKEALIFGLHRLRLAQLTGQQREAIMSLWAMHLLRAEESSDWFLEDSNMMIVA